MRVKIDEIEYYLPGKILTNSELHTENPHWDMKNVEERSGVIERHIAADNETALDLAINACDKLFENPKNDRANIDAVIFCTQSPDYIMPSNAFLLHKHLGLSENVLAFDFNLACSGYIYGLAIASSLIVSKTARNILFATGDTYSKYINKKDRSARVLFGDGAAVTLLSSSDSEEGIIDVILSTSGKDYDKFYIPAGGCRFPISEDTSIEECDQSGNVRTKNNIFMDGMGVWSFIQSTVPKQIRTLLNRNSLTKDDIDLYVFHQASKLTLDSLVKSLRIDDGKVYMNLSHIGNTVSASIPIALKGAFSEGRIKPGSKVLLSGFGVGLSWGSLIMQF